MTNRSEDIVVTGIGLICPLGKDLDTLWNALMEKRIAAKHWPDLQEQLFRNTIAARIEDFDVPALSRGREMAFYAVSMAIHQAQIDLPENTGFFVGSTIGDSHAFEEIQSHGAGKLYEANCYGFGKFILDRLNSKGFIRAYGAACAAGNYALGSAAEFLRNGWCDVAVAGGVDPFSRIAMAGFARSRAMSPNGECKPFDIHRNGMILGEGAAFFVLESATHAQLRKATPLCRIGYLGLSCDAHHPTAPEPGGKGMMRAMQLSLELSNLSHQQIDWVCSHGSGTPISDTAEAKALTSVFEGRKPLVSAFKPAIGHTLGAATALEAAICMKSIQQQTIPPTANVFSPDPDLGIELVTAPKLMEINHVMNCGFAFGGLNSSLIISRNNVL